MVLPYLPTDVAGLPRFLLESSVTSASPNVHTVTLPEQGCYLLSCAVFELNLNNSAWVSATTAWMAPLGGTSNMIRKTNLIGTFGGSNAEPTGLTISDPSTSGVLTVTFTHSHAGSVQSKLRLWAYRMNNIIDWSF